MDGSETVIRFDRFELDRARFELRCDGVPVSIERQVFDVLSYLLANRGRVVTKEELLDNVWGTRFVTESALTTQIKFARRALGDSGTEQRFIRTVHRRGYEFTVPDDDRMASARSARSPSMPKPTGAAPPAQRWSPVQLIGREDVIADVEQRIAESRMVTIVGAGGVGKTQLALAVADRLADGFRDGVVAIDLVSLSDPDDIPRVAAEAARLGRREGVAVADALAQLNALVVIDNCEHVIDAAAEFVERLLARPTDPVRVISTSREPLRIIGEVVVPLGPLSLVSSSGHASAAARLFIERVGREGAELRGDEVEQLVAILDGVPLAIELAASQVGFLSLSELRRRLEQHRYTLEVEGRGPQRSTSLAASVAWSWDLLDEEEQRTLTEFSVFPGDWGLDAVEGIATSDDPLGVLRRLVGKSLVANAQTNDVTRFHLLFGVRDFVRPFQADLPDGPSGLRRRFVSWLADWLDEWSFEEQWVSSDFLEALLAERTSIRAAMKVDDRDLVEAVGRLVAASAAAYRFGVGVSQGRRLDAVVDVARLPDDIAARVALAGSEAAYAFGDVAATHDLAARAHTLAESAGRPELISAALVQSCFGRMVDDPNLCAELLATAVEHARSAGTSRMESLALALRGFCLLGAGEPPVEVLTIAGEADALAAPFGWDRICVATLRGSARLMEGDDPDGAAAEFFSIADGARASGLTAAGAMYELLAVTCRAECAEPEEVRDVINLFLPEYHRATGHAGHADALTLIAHRAAARGDGATAIRILESLHGRRLAHRVGVLAMRRTADLVGLPQVDEGPSVSAPQSDPVLIALMDEQLALLD